MNHSDWILKDLGDGLVIRKARRSDVQALSDFNARIHSDDGPQAPDQRIGVWTQDLMEKPHPTFDPGDFTIVEDRKTGQIVSSMNLISQTWSYRDIPFRVGRPELVGTLPEYRNRGLVRAQFEIIHQWSRERCELVQAITGIPYYYRQFGYEMGLSLGGQMLGYQANVPRLETDQEPYRFRSAIQDDLDFIANLYQQSNHRYLIHCLRDRALWEYELSGKSDQNVNRVEIKVIESLQGEPVGYLVYPPWIWGQRIAALAYEIKPGISWSAVTPSTIRYLYATGEAYAKTEGKQGEFTSFAFRLGVEHPVYTVAKNHLPVKNKPYAWYVRVPDIPGFLNHIKSVLEERLSSSDYAGYTGELKLSFYHTGIKLSFEQGCIPIIEPWQPTPQAFSGEAIFPGMVFLQLLFGYRSMNELDLAFADCYTRNDEIAGLIGALFPVHVSNIWPIA